VYHVCHTTIVRDCLHNAILLSVDITTAAETSGCSVTAAHRASNMVIAVLCDVVIATLLAMYEQSSQVS
jgi:hypothetical protein